MKPAMVLVVAAVFVAIARPGEQAVPEGTTIKLLLLRQKSVQQELKLSADQKQKIADFTHKQHEEFLESEKLGATERKKKHADMEKENAAFLKDALAANQRKRLDQIAMQITALHHLLIPDVARELKLTDAQLQKFKVLQKEARKELVNVIHAKEAKGRNKKLAKLREDTREKILAVLTDAQKEQVREMVGPAFNGELLFEEVETIKKK
jgi:hypothetical protein